MEPFAIRFAFEAQCKDPINQARPRRCWDIGRAEALRQDENAYKARVKRCLNMWSRIIDAFDEPISSVHRSACLPACLPGCLRNSILHSWIRIQGSQDAGMPLGGNSAEEHNSSRSALLVRFAEHSNPNPLRGIKAGRARAAENIDPCSDKPAYLEAFPIDCRLAIDSRHQQGPCSPAQQDAHSYRKSSAATMHKVQPHRRSCFRSRN